MKVETSLPLDTPGLAQPSHALGAYLQEIGGLRQEDVERIEQARREAGGRFGESAVRLGLATPLQVQQALARQYGYPASDSALAALHPELLLLRSPHHPFSEAMRRLRTRLMLHWQPPAASAPALCIASARRKDGRSLVAANLAIAFAQANIRTVLVDLDLRSPRQHELFGMDNRLGASSLLIGRYAAGDLKGMGSCETLTVLPAGPLPPNPQELLDAAHLVPMLSALRAMFGMIVIDTPAWCSAADVQLIAAQAGAAVPVVPRHRAAQREVHDLVRALRHSGADVPAAALTER